MGTLAQAMEAPFRLGTGTHTELSKVIGVNNKERGITRAAVASSSSSSSKQASSIYKTPILQDPDSQNSCSFAHSPGQSLLALPKCGFSRPAINPSA
jgi:hypothetical protein